MDGDKVKFLIDNDLLDLSNTILDEVKKFDVFASHNLNDLGKELVDNIGGLSELVLENNEEEFDYYYFARDHLEDGNIFKIGDTYVRKNK